MSDALINRAEILIQQNRHKEASNVLSDLLATDPNNIRVLAMLSEVKLQIDKAKDSEELINTAISLAPGSDYLYFIKSRVSLALKKFDEAEGLLQQAISINPQEAAFFALWASIKLHRKQFGKALELADKSLELDPENVHGLNIRSAALLKLDRKEESFKTIEGALNEDPNNPYTHSNYGWGHLERGDHKKALHHFKEALKNDPSLVNAQAGMIEALKAKYFLYRLFLKYSFWMGNLTSKYQWGVIIGLYLVVKVLGIVASENPTIEPFLTPIIICLVVIAFSTWITTPISNLFLRLNAYGRHLLNKKERLSSNFVGVCLLLFAIGMIGLFLFGDATWLVISVFGFAMMIPCSAMFSHTKYKNSLLIYAIGMAVVGILAISATFTTGEVFTTFGTVFIFGFVGFQWIANFLVIKESNV